MSNLVTSQLNDANKTSTSWPIVPLGELVIPIERPEMPVPGITYRQIGVRLWGQGAYEREPLDGGQTKYDTLSRVEADDIIVNKIWARNGSVSVVPPELAGCYVSTEFPLFVAVKEKLYPRWFFWLTKTRPFWAQCDEKSQGTSGKNRIRPEQFLKILIPLPPLDEQRRIVARIDALAARIEEARGLRRGAEEEAERLWLASAREILSSISETSTLKEGATVICGQHLTPDEQAEAGIPYITGPADFTERVAIPSRYALLAKATSLPDDVLLTVKGAGVGKVNLAPAFETVIGRQLFAVRPYPDKLSTLFLFFVLQFRLSSLRNAITATTVPGIGRDDVESLEIPFPSLDEQRRIVAYLDELLAKADALKQLQAETAAELEALLPAVLDQAFRGEL